MRNDVACYQYFRASHAGIYRALWLTIGQFPEFDAGTSVLVRVASKLWLL